MTTALAETKSADRGGLVSQLADRFGMDRGQFWETISKTIMPNAATKEQTLSFLAVANEYKLSPFTKEIYAFPTKGGGVQPIVSIDGWIKITNDHPQFNGVEFADVLAENGELVSVTCRMFRKDRERPIETVEYMVECKRETEPWKKWPRRMLRHKAYIQCARVAFGFSGIADPDEGERIREAIEVVPISTDNPRAPSSAAKLAGKLGVAKIETADELEARAVVLRGKLRDALEKKAGPDADKLLLVLTGRDSVDGMNPRALDEWTAFVDAMTEEDVAVKLEGATNA